MKLTDMLYSFPNNRRCIQHFSGTSCLRQPIALGSAQDGTNSRTGAGASDRCLRATQRVPSGRASWRAEGVYDWYQGCFCCCRCLLWHGVLVLLGYSDEEASDSYKWRSAHSDGLIAVDGLGFTGSILGRRTTLLASSNRGIGPQRWRMALFLQSISAIAIQSSLRTRLSFLLCISAIDNQSSLIKWIYQVYTAQSHAL